MPRKVPPLPPPRITPGPSEKWPRGPENELDTITGAEREVATPSTRTVGASNHNAAAFAVNLSMRNKACSLPRCVWPCCHHGHFSTDPSGVAQDFEAAAGIVEAAASEVCPTCCLFKHIAGERCPCEQPMNQNGEQKHARLSYMAKSRGKEAVCVGDSLDLREGGV